MLPVLQRLGDAYSF